MQFNFKCLHSFLLIFFMTSTLLAQDRDYEHIAARVTMDELVVTATKSGFSVEDFIDVVVNDESFYAAFKQLRKLSYLADNNIVFYKKDWNTIKSSYASRTQQDFDGQCRTMTVLSEMLSPNFKKKNKEYKYYTAALFDRVFFTDGKVCESNEKKDTSTLPVASEQSSKIEQHMASLKRLIFAPGKAVDVPFIGKKTAIFEPQMAEYYNYDISMNNYRGKDAYIFRLASKPELHIGNENKTIIKYMETYFEKGTLKVLGRNYHMKYNGAIFQFDVKMEVEISEYREKQYVSKVGYKGSWNIPFTKTERGKFSMKVTPF